MDEAEKISKRTWNRNNATVTKVGFMDGASNGQNAVFQSSFNLGYQQGLNFGFEIGFKKAIREQEFSKSSERRREIVRRDEDVMNYQLQLIHGDISYARAWIYHKEKLRRP